MGVPAPLIPEGSLLNSSAPRVAIALAQAIALMMSVAFINRRAIPAVPALLSGGARTLDWHLFVPSRTKSG